MDKSEQEETGTAGEPEERRAEQVLQKERMGWRGKHALQSEEKMFVDLQGAERKV